MSVNTQIQLRRGTSSEWIDVDPVLSSGELGYEIDTGNLKIGDGSNSWTSLSYSNILPTNIIAGSGIELVYDGSPNTLTINVIQNAGGQLYLNSNFR